MIRLVLEFWDTVTYVVTVFRGRDHAKDHRNGWHEFWAEGRCAACKAGD